MRIPYSTRWCLIFFILMQFPTLLSSLENDRTAPKPGDSFLVRLGKWKMRVAETKCLHRIEKLPRKKEVAVRHCEINGTWELTPYKNESFTNYSMCYAFTEEKMMHAYMMFYLAVVGHSASLINLITAMAIFLHFKSLACQRVTMHKNMFMSYILNSIGVLVHLTQVVPNIDYVNSDPLSCKILNCIIQYLMLCNYSWMLCEGIYLHKLIVVNVFTGEQKLKWYYFLGWGVPVVPTVAHAIARLKNFDDSCWMSVETNLVYIIHGPIMLALTVNFFFMLNILRVLLQKIKNDGHRDAKHYLKAVKAILFLVPLLGIQFVIFPWRPHSKIPARIYDYVMHFLSHFQGFFVSTIYCFFNSSVQEVLSRRFQVLKTRWQNRNGVPRNQAAARNQERDNNEVQNQIEVQAEINMGEEIHNMIPMEILEQELGV